MDEQPQQPEQQETNPPAGGRWLRDPQTGALVPYPETPPAAGAPDQE